MNQDGYKVTIEMGKTKAPSTVADKDRKPFCADLKRSIGNHRKKVLEALERVTKKWNEKAPVCIRYT